MRRWSHASSGWRCTFDLANKEQTIVQLEGQAERPDLWDNPQDAQRLLRQLARLKEEVTTWRDLGREATALQELIELAVQEEDLSLRDSLEAESRSIASRIASLEFQATLSGEYDERNAILAIHSGAGGTDSQDWVKILMRMYLGWAERHGYETEIMDMSPGEGLTGIKRVVMEVKGKYAYGYLKAERGVHRLVRISPYADSDQRHTSFALVEGLPEVEEQPDVTLRPEELRIDAFRAGGHGGQNVQKTSTAVRITHLPTGIVVTCQNERSQRQNKEFALKILRARVMDLELQRRAEEQAQLKGEHIAPEFGNQARSYVLHPYQMVKDHRTGYETPDTERVLEGDLDEIIHAYLLYALRSQESGPSAPAKGPRNPT